MRITHTVDPDAATVALTLVFGVDIDPDRAADVAWEAVGRILSEKREVPDDA